MALQSVEQVRRELDPSFALTIETTELTRWWEPSAHHVTWRLRLTNASDEPVSRLTAYFTYVGNCGTLASGLTLTSRSSRGNRAKAWGMGTSLFKSYPGTLAAWETMILTGVFSSASNAGGSVSVFLGGGTPSVSLGTLYDDF